MTDTTVTSPPRVSIGLPVFNGENYLAEAVDSILAQTFEDFELIICDNASTDGTEDICRAAAQRDPRVRYHRQPENLGACRNYDMTFEMSRGAFFKWAAHDDNLAPEYLDKLVAALDADSGCVLAYPATDRINKHGETGKKIPNGSADDSEDPVRRFSSLLLPEMAHPNPVFGLIRRDVMARTPLHGDYIGSDRSFLAALFFEGRWAAIPETLFFRRVHPLRSTTSHSRHDDRLFWYRGKRPKFPVFKTWRLMRGLLSVVRNAPIRARQRRAAYSVVLRWAWVYRARLGSELMLPYYINGEKTRFGRALDRGVRKSARWLKRGVRALRRGLNALLTKRG